MKKLSVLVALMLIITVGGVYATWNYVSYENNATTASEIISVTLADDIVEKLTKGGLAVRNSTLTISIDDPAPQDYIAELIVGGQISFEYTPADSSADDEIYMNYTIEANAGTYKGQPILTVDAGPFALMDMHTGSDATLLASDLMDHIHLADITLATHEEYQDFETALANTTITITVHEGLVNNDGH